MNVDLKEWDDLYTVNGVPVKLGNDTERELDEVGLHVEDLIQGIKQGGPCPDAWPRRRGHEEICFRHGYNVIRVVCIRSYSIDDGCECIFVKHIGEVI